jgi:hypothetical protein
VAAKAAPMPTEADLLTDVYVSLLRGARHGQEDLSSGDQRGAPQEMERDPRVIIMGEDVAGGMGAPGEQMPGVARSA